MNTAECTTHEPDRSAPRVPLPVLIVDADAHARERLSAIVRAAGWQAMVFASAEELLADSHSLLPACILLDIELPGLSGLELQQLLAKRAGMVLVFASACRDVRLTVRAMKSGAINFLTKPVDRDAVVNAIAEALERGRASLRCETEERALRHRFAALSGREREVMSLVIEGRLNKQIASELSIAEITVKVHRARVMRKTGATSLADLVRLAGKLGIGSPMIDRAHLVDVGHRRWITAAERV